MDSKTKEILNQAVKNTKTAKMNSTSARWYMRGFAGALLQTRKITIAEYEELIDEIGKL